ncbi:hypothetical protein [Streptomyces sp. NBC_00316]|uniref:hypothetical protein n=1 Tax=Streptomyces sp. NBC_00316 TaxID=2975710 RepID=UPI002E2BBA71|nr:hypothetical protein [Streptomyces sp. NBC_00316]
MTMNYPQSYEILLVPGFTDATAEPANAAEQAARTEQPGRGERTEDAGDAPASVGAIRSAVVEATGETGASGYPRYAGEGMVADIDPVTRTVEALLIDGAELDYGLSVRVAERKAES